MNYITYVCFCYFFAFFFFLNAVANQHAEITFESRFITLKMMMMMILEENDNNVTILGELVCSSSLQLTSELREARRCALSLKTSQENLPLPPFGCIHPSWVSSSILVGAQRGHVTAQLLLLMQQQRSHCSTVLLLEYHCQHHKQSSVRSLNMCFFLLYLLATNMILMNGMCPNNLGNSAVGRQCSIFVFSFFF